VHILALRYLRDGIDAAMLSGENRRDCEGLGWVPVMLTVRAGVGPQPADGDAVSTARQQRRVFDIASANTQRPTSVACPTPKQLGVGSWLQRQWVGN